MKDYIEVDTRSCIQGVNERVLIKKSDIKCVIEEKSPKGEYSSTIGLAHTVGNAWTKLESVTPYDEIRTALIDDTNEAKEIAEQLYKDIEENSNNTTVIVDGRGLHGDMGYALEGIKYFKALLYERLEKRFNREDRKE